MLITRFNRLIHNKLIWICFAVLVCVVFVFSGAGLSNGLSAADEQQNPKAGTLRGEPVTMRDYHLAMAYEQGIGNPAPKTDAEKKALETETWKRLAAKGPIEAMGISVSDQDLLEVIQQEFSQNGVFNKDTYRAILYEKLRMSEESFEAYLRDVLLYQKAAGVFESCVWTPPMEVDKRLKDLSDEFVLHYTLMDAESMVEEPELTESELKDFYDENRESFEITEERKVRYVAFSITNHLPDIVVKEEDIQRYYQLNAEKYQGLVTNGPTLPPDLRQEIELTLQYDGATDKAREAAMTMATALVQNRSVAPNSEAFLAQATAMGLPIHTTAYFVADEPVPGLAATRDFNRAAFLLTAQRPISDAVVGADSVYLLDLIDQRGPRIPEFDEIESRVRTFAAFSSRYETFREKAKEFEEALEKRLPQGDSFKMIAEGFGLSVATTTAFSVYSPNVASNDLPVVEALDQVIVTMKAGEATPLIPTKNGALIAYVASREPADPLSIQVLKPQLIRSLNRYRASAVLDDWKTYLLAQADLVDSRPVAPKPVTKEEAATDQTPSADQQQADEQ